MSEFLDFSGYSNNYTYESGDAGPGHERLPTAAGAGGYAVKSSNEAILSGPNPLFGLTGVLPDNYTYEAWVHVIGTGSAEQQIYGLSDDDYIEGLIIDGTVVSFKVMYANEDDTVLSFDTGFIQRLHILGTHSKFKDELWINGELVSELDTTAAQQADTLYEHDVDTARIGLSLEDDSSPIQILTVNAVSVFGKVLNPDTINRHWLMGTNYASSNSIVNNWKGEKYDVHAIGTDVFMDITWTTNDDWNLGHMNGIRISDGELRPHISDSVSLGGTWLRNIFLANAGDDAIAGINFDWYGEGLVVEVSLDGDTWEEVVQGRNVALIPSGFDPSDTNLYLRVTFEDGSTDDDQFLDYIHIVGVRTQSQQIYARTVTIEGHRLRDYHPMDQHDMWGLALDTGDTITISSNDDEEPSPILAVEVWVKDIAGDFPTTNMLASADFVTVQDYVVADTGDVYDRMEPGAWYRLMFLFTSEFTDDIIITGPGQVGFVAVYSTEIESGLQYQKQFWEYTGTFFNTFTDQNAITVTENVERTRAYALDWTITAS